MRTTAWETWSSRRISAALDEFRVALERRSRRRTLLLGTQPASRRPSEQEQKKIASEMTEKKAALTKKFAELQRKLSRAELGLSRAEKASVQKILHKR